ncbi:MAG: DUF4294 domain-containing protein [Bacteroidales bacterium]|nr:DUF4294 domain-containing protein [Bacteroidales bacterium]
MIRSLLNILFLISASLALNAQDTVKVKTDSLPGRFYLLENVTRDGETMPEVEIDEVNVVRKMGLKERFQWWKYRRLVSNVKKVYPYSLVVRERLSEVNDTLMSLDSDRERRKYLRNYEKNLFGEYEDDIKHMSITQGKILIKLIDRETQRTSYKLIKDYRGAVSAFFWQGIARIFGSDLKSEYDPDGEDYLIEKVIYEIENGRI